MISRPAAALPQASASRPLLRTPARTCVRQIRVLLSSAVPTSNVSPWFCFGSAQRSDVSVAASRQPQEGQPERTPSQADTKMTTEELEFWQPFLERLQRQDAILARQRLDLKYKMGMSWNFMTWREKKLGLKPHGWDVMLKGKVANPKRVVMVRVGKFYEAAGLDAIMLVEHCTREVGGPGINFMGRKLQAGVHVSSIHHAIQQLVQEAGLEVAVYEETGDSPGMKIRELAQVVTLENPQYTYLDNCAEAFGDIRGLSSAW